MKKLIFLVTITLGSLFAFTKPASAAIRCETQYGGGQVCVTTGQLQINKKIWHPEKKEWRDNIFSKNIDGDNGYDFKTSEFVKFKLIVKNVGNDTLHNVKLTDVLPDFLFFTGTTPKEFKWDTFNPGVTEERKIEARVISESQLKYDRDCDVNTAEVNSDENEHDKDTAKLCVIKQVLGVTTLPKTGPSNTFLILSLSGLTGLAGVALIRLGKKTA